MQEEMRKRFFIYDVPLVYLNKKGYIEDEIISNADVIIHQNIRAENSFGHMLSSEYIKKGEKSSCLDICIPNLFGMGRAFWPNVEMNNQMDKPLNQGVGLFPYKDLNVDFEGLKPDNLLRDIVLNDFFYPSEAVIENFNSEVKKIKEREAECNIKIYNYIMDNYRKKRMFWDPGHPTNDVILEMCRQITDLLISDKEMAEKIKKEILINNEMDTFQMPVYASVRKILDFDWDDSDMRKYTGNKLSEQMDTAEFYKEYIYWCGMEIKEKI